MAQILIVAIAIKLLRLRLKLLDAVGELIPRPIS